MSHLLLAVTSSHILGSPYLSLTMAVARMEHDPRWDMKLQENSFYTQEETGMLRPPALVSTLMKSRHWLNLGIWASLRGKNAPGRKGWVGSYPSSTAST